MSAPRRETLAEIASEAHDAFDEVARERIVQAGIGPFEAELDAALDAVYEHERTRLSMAVVYLAEMESEHFQWRAVGRSEEEARAALVKVWDAHAEQIADDDRGFADIMAGVVAVEHYGVNVHRAPLGVGLRDGEEVTTCHL